MRRVRGQGGLIVVAIAIALIIVRCGGGPDGGGDEVVDAGPTTTAPPAGYLSPDGPAEAMAIFRSALGDGLKVREASFYPEYVIIEAQDPAKPQNIDRYTLRDGAIGDFEQFVEIGPGAVLAGLLRRIDRAAPARALGSAKEVTDYLREEA